MRGAGGGGGGVPPPLRRACSPAGLPLSESRPLGAAPGRWHLQAGCQPLLTCKEGPASAPQLFRTELFLALALRLRKGVSLGSPSPASPTLALASSGWAEVREMGAQRRKEEPLKGFLLQLGFSLPAWGPHVPRTRF